MTDRQPPAFKTAAGERPRKQDSEDSRDNNDATEKDRVEAGSFSARQRLKGSSSRSRAAVSGRFGGRRRRCGDSREQVYRRLCAWAGQSHE